MDPRVEEMLRQMGVDDSGAMGGYFGGECSSFQSTRTRYGHGGAVEETSTTTTTGGTGDHGIWDGDDDDAVFLFPGARVRLVGLLAKPELNGKRGRCKGVTQTGRRIVQLDSCEGGQCLAFKPTNLAMEPFGTTTTTDRRRHSYQHPGAGATKAKTCAPYKHQDSVARADAAWAERGSFGGGASASHFAELPAAVSAALMALPARRLKQQCADRGVDTAGCLEKRDFVRAMGRFYGAFRSWDVRTVLVDYSAARQDTFVQLNRVRQRPALLIPAIQVGKLDQKIAARYLLWCIGVGGTPAHPVLELPPHV